MNGSRHAGLDNPFDLPTFKQEWFHCLHGPTLKYDPATRTVQVCVDYLQELIAKANAPVMMYAAGTGILHRDFNRDAVLVAGWRWQQLNDAERDAKLQDTVIRNLKNMNAESTSALVQENADLRSKITRLRLIIDNIFNAAGEWLFFTDYGPASSEVSRAIDAMCDIRSECRRSKDPQPTTGEKQGSRS